jgi:GrpB-like predicted nucleotidyltransferase (UPF0157 family)
LSSERREDRELSRESAVVVQVRVLIVVADYDPAWPRTFAFLRDRAWPVVAPFASSIEHVGSTSVPGLAAKPVIDMDVLAHDVFAAIRALETLGYHHEGDKGIPGREAMKEPAGDPRHHLYVGARDAAPITEHLRFRDYLRGHPDAAAEYAALKRRLAGMYDDIEDYAVAKTDFVRACLAAAK